MTVAGRLTTAPMVAALKERMGKFTINDYLIAVGDPSVLAAAACIAVRKTGGTLRLLKWDRYTSDYLLAELNV